jgi:hypothetical protein
MLLQFLNGRVRSRCSRLPAHRWRFAGVVSPASLAQEVIAGHKRNVSARSSRKEKPNANGAAYCQVRYDTPEPVIRELGKTVSCRQ